MRLFMTPAGEDAWYSALVRNVRMQITRVEVGVLDVYTLSGNKQAGKTTAQFRAMNYAPEWTPDFNDLRANDTIVYSSDSSAVGFWRITHNDGGLIVRVPATVADMDIGNIRIYAKNTGPYPVATEKAQRYKRYEEVYDDDHGGEVLLCVGFSSVADTHWKADTIFPHSFDYRLGIYAEGLFQVLDRSQFAFEGVVSVYEAPTEVYLKQPAAQAYGVAVVASHSKTNKPAVFYRAHGLADWVGYPLNETFSAPLELPVPIADINIDSALLDHGAINPPAIIDAPQGVVISSQPRQITLTTLAFTQKDVNSYSARTTTQTLTLAPNTGQPYTTTIRVADLAFLGTNQQLYVNVNGTRYRLCANGKSYDTPPLIIRNGDSIYLEGTLQGPISSLTGTIYAVLNEAPISNDTNNTLMWLVGKVSMHITSTIIPQPNKVDYGITGRRLGVYNWDEYTPEQRVTGLGYDMYGIPNTANITIRVAPTAGHSGGTSFEYGGGQLANDTRRKDFLPNGYEDVQGNPVIRRGITGMAGTQLAVYKNGVNVGVISTPAHAEGSCTFSVVENDRISFRATLVGQPYSDLLLQQEVLPAMALAIEGIVNESGIGWLTSKFDIATCNGPDTVAPTTGTLPTLSAVTPLPQLVGVNSLADMADAYLINSSHGPSTPSQSQPYIAYGNWLTLMAAPNPTLTIGSAPLTVLNTVITGTADHGVTVELEKFNGWGSTLSTTLINNSIAQSGLSLSTVHSEDCYRIKVTHKDPDVRVQATLRLVTDAGNIDLLIDSAVRSS